MLVNYYADGQTFKFQLRPAQEFQFQFLLFQQSDSVWLRVPRQWPGMPRSLSLAGVTNCCWIHPTLFYLTWRPSREWRDTSRIDGLIDRRSMSKRLQTRLPLTYWNCPKCGGFWCVWKNDSWYFHLCQNPHKESFSTWKIILSSKCFSSTFERLLFHDRYASAQRAAHCASRTACGIETSKARVPRHEPQKARVPWY